MSFLRNHWYVAAWSHERPTGTREEPQPACFDCPPAEMADISHGM